MAMNSTQPKKCYIYTRVSTAMQVDGFSLDAQRDRLRAYAKAQGMVIVGEYSDEGKSGKNVEGRPEFLQMLDDIENGKDGVSFVLVFKLSRFGRNAADVLTTLQSMQDCGVNLVCVEDGIDSSKDSGKLVISVIKKISPWERNKSSGWCYRKPKFHISKPNIPLMVKNSPRQLAPISG